MRTKIEHRTISGSPEPSAPAPEDIETAADQAIATCGGDAREAVKALIVANSFLEAQIWGIHAGSTNCRATAKVGTIDPVQSIENIGRPRAAAPTCQHELSEAFDQAAFRGFPIVPVFAAWMK
jgi:hypothetical protein